MLNGAGPEIMMSTPIITKSVKISRQVFRQKYKVLMIINGDDALLEQSAIAVVGTDMERLALGLRVSVVT